MSYSIFVCAHLDQRAHDLVLTSLPNDRVHFGSRDRIEPSDREALENAEVIFGNLPAIRIPACRRLRWMQLESIGFEYYQELAGGTNGLVISNLKGMFVRPATETALAGILALIRGLDRLVPAQTESRWIELELRPQTRRLHGMRVLVLGLGSIGRRMKRLLEAFDSRVTTFARRNREADVTTVAQLAEVLPEADIIVCCLPQTRETMGLVDRRLLELMSPRAVFVNIGRSAVVDEGALIERLQQRRLAGAVIDVTLAEPLPPDHPLWHCPNTILTQHTGGGYDDELVDKARFFLKNLELFRRGEQVLNVIDVGRGY